MFSPPPLTSRSRRDPGPWRSQVPLAGHVGSMYLPPRPLTMTPLQTMPRSVGSDFGPTCPITFRPLLYDAVHCGAPDDPRLVKIWMTPPDASVPYRVVAAAPFTISTRSMSSALMSLNAFVLWRADAVTG